jgi:hypothetical protein
MRHEEEKAAAAALEGNGAEPFRTQCTDPDTEVERVRALFDAMMEAKKKAGQPADPNSFPSFRQFVKKKTQQIRKEFGCSVVEYSVEMQDGQPKLKARAKS